MAEAIVKKLDAISEALEHFRRDLSLYICKASMKVAETYPEVEEDIIEILINSLITSAARDAIDSVTIKYRLSSAILERNLNITQDISNETMYTVAVPTNNDFV